MGAFEDLINQGKSSSEEEEKKKTFDDLVNQGSEARNREEVQKVDNNYINSFFNNATSFYDNFLKDFEGMSWDNAASVYSNTQTSLDSLNKQGDLIEKWMMIYRDQLDDTSYKSLKEALGSWRTETGKIMDSLTQAKDYYDPEKNKEAYLASKEYQRILNYDVDAEEKRIRDLEKFIEENKEDEDVLYHWVAQWGNEDIPQDVQEEMDIIRNRINDRMIKYGITDIPEGMSIEEYLSKVRSEHVQAKRTKKEYEMSSVVNEPDFEEYSAKGGAFENPSYDDANGGAYIFGWRPGADEVKNKVTFARENGDALFAERHSGSGNVTTPSVVDPIYRHMTEDEVSIYNYYLAKYGVEKADEYLASLEDKLSRREADEEFGRMQGNTFREVMYGVTAGADQFKSGMIGMWDSLFGDSDYIPPSSIQYTGQLARQDLEDNGPKILGSSLGQIGYDTLSTTTNMVPSIIATSAIGTVNPLSGVVVGRGLMGASAAGNAYQQKLNAGYSKDEARTYGYLVGASEIATESLFGGVSLMGRGILTSKGLSMLSKMDNVFSDVARTAGGRLVVGALGEAVEEGLQSIIEPYIWQAVSGEEASVDWEETLYSSLLGALSGGIFEAGPAIQTSIQNHNAKVTYGDNQGALVNHVLEFDPNNQYAQSMKNKVDAGKNLSGVQLSHLAEIRNKGIRDNVRYGFEERLRENGETGDVYAISEALAKKSFGEELTRSEKRLIAKSEYAQSIAQELDAAVESAQSEDVATEGITPEEYAGIVKDAEAVVNEADEIESTAKVEDLKSEIASLQETVRNPDISAEEKAVATEQLEAARQELKTLESSEEAQSAPKKVKVTAKVATAPVTIEEASKKYGAQAKAMVATYNQGQNVRMFDSAYSVAYEMGKTSSVLLDDALNSEATQYLTPEQREHAFNAGRSAAVARDNARNQRAKASGKGANIGRRKGSVSAQGVKMADLRKTFNDPQNKAYKTLVTIANATGINIVLIKSEVDAQGRYIGDNGKFQWKDDTIFIDINAGLDYARDTGEFTKYSMLRTFSHEFTHFIEKNAPIEYSALRDLVFAEMKARGENVDSLILDKKTKYKNISYEAASREVVADVMSDMLRDSSFIEKLTQKHQSIAQKILTKLKEFLADIKSYFAQLADNPSLDAKAIQQEVDGMMKYAESIIEAFDTAAVAAVENYQGMTEDVVSELTPGEEGVVVAEDGEPVARSTKDGTVMLSIRTYEEEGRSAFRTYLEKCVKNQSLTKEEMQEMLDGIEEIYTVCKEFKDKYAPFSAWSDAEVIRDTRGKPVFSVVTPNGEYKMNLDFSLVCKKRRALDAVLNEMCKRGIIDNFELGPKTIVKINELIRKNKLETACSLCFVDAKRFRQADVADSVVRLYNELVQSLVPEEHSRSIDHFNFAGYGTITPTENGIHTWPNSKLDFSHINEVLKQYGKNTVEAKAARYIKNNPEARRLLLRGDFMSSSGFDAVKTQNPNIMKIYNSKKGTGGPKAAFGDVQYMNEIISNNKSWTPEKAYDVGGVRIQSFSDYVPRMVFDYVQMIYDLAAKKLPAHAYTKEALFVKQFGLTGIKINMSLIPAIVEGGIAPGLDANGKYAWAGESFDFETAKDIQKANGYSENCGTIAVGVSYEHIMKLLGDPEIRMVIPYHKSSLNPIVAHMNRIGKYTDYTKAGKTPVEHGGQRTTNKDGKTIEHEFNFAKTLHEVGDPKAVADQYLAWCDKNGYTPKFDEFKGHENYYKLLTDFTVYDKSGTYVPQREVKATFPKEGNTFGSMEKLIQSGLEEDAIIEGRRKSKMSEMVDEIERSIPRTEAEIPDDEQVEQADHDLEAELMDENRVQKSIRSYEDDYAPTFYSQMEKVVSGMKQEKFGASSVVDMLRGRGVKAEEIKWSGIEAWLDGKKSVTKAELQEFIAGSMLQIEEDVLGDTEIPYSQEHLDQIAKYESERDIIVEQLKSEWKRIVGTDIPINYFGAGLESAVVNNLILVNKGKKDNTEVGYQHRAKRAALERVIEDSEDHFGFDNARQAFREAVKDPKGFMKAYELTAFEESVFKDFIKAKEAYGKVEGISIDDMKALKAIAESADRFSNRIVDVKNKHRSEAAKHLSKYRAYTIKGGRNYRELLFRIPESNYSNGAMYAHWERSGVLAHARIQDINTFLGKMLFIEELQSDWHNEGRKTGYEGVPDAPFRDNYHEFVLKKLIRMAAEQGYDSIGWTPAEIQSERWSDEFAEGYRIEYDQDIPKFLNKYGKKWDTKVGKTVLDSGTAVWSMAITDAMKDSVLYEGQAQYQKRTNTLTDHEILDMAAKELDTAKLTDGEKAALEIFRKKNDALKALKDERQKQGSLYYQYQFGDQKDTAKATAARNRMTVLDEKITKASAEVLGIEDKKILKDVLQKSRKVIEQTERKASIERVKAAREETRAKERQIANEKLEALRQKKNERIAEVRAEERQKAQEKAENRKKTELRTKIQKQLSELNSLLQNGNKKKNVKNGMKDTASALLAYGELLFSDDANLTPEALVRNGIETDLTEAESKLLNEYNDLLEKRDLYLGQINEAASGTDANKDARIEGLQKMVDIINQKKLPALIKKLDGIFERERARLNKVTFSAVLKDLTDSYKALEKSKDPYVSGAYNQYVYDRLVAMNNPDAGVATTIKDMSLTQLAELNDAIKMVVTSIKNANTLFRDGQREVLSERAEQVFMEIRKLYRKGGDPAAFKNAVTDAIKSFAWNELKPIYAFERIGSEKFTELFWDVINGESEYGLECDKAADFVKDTRDTYGYKKWDFDKVKVFKTADGLDFKLTLGDMMSIYAYSRRDQAHKHMFEGGFTFHTGKTEIYRDTDGKKRVRLIEEDTYRMTPELLDEILSSLSDEQKSYAEAMQDYLTKLGEMGNKVSRILYGIDLFKETHYFPLKSDRDYRSTVEAQLNQTQTAASLVNIGMAKETVPEASNPIVLQRFDDVAIRHIDQMLKYSSMVLPIENLRKVMDFAPGDYGTWNAPVKKIISSVHGVSASQYVNQWLTDLNGSSSLDGARNPLSSLFARHKKVAVAGNLSVVVQQYFAIFRAMSEIDGKYFVSSDGKTDTNQWEELKKWAGVAVIKEMGGFDMGSARSATDFIGEAGAKTGIMRKIDEAASYGAAKMDQVGWSRIWKAVKAEITDTTNLKVGTEEFFKVASKRFTEVIVRTQVYDSVTARSGFMRSKSESVKYLVSFMGEPTTTFNMMLNAQMKLLRAHRDGYKASVKKARSYMARTSGSVILSTVLGIIAKSAVYAMRDDDDTESFMERWMKQFGSSLHQELNPLELLPMFRDIMSIVKGRDVERPDLDLISSTVKAFKKAVKEDEVGLEAWWDLALSVLNMAGIPLKNVWRDTKGIARLYKDATDGVGPKDIGKAFFDQGFLGNEQTKNEKLYDAIVSEDAGRLEVLRKGYKSATDYTNAIRKALRECDDRIHAAAQARYEGDTMTYMELAKEIIAEGHFVQDDVVAAIMTELSAIEKEAEGEKESTPKTYTMYTVADYLSVVDQPKHSKEIKDYLIAEYMEKGKNEAEAEAEFKSDVKDQVKTWYTDEESEVRITKQEATEMLRKYVGMNADEVTSTINQWSSKVVTGIAYDDIKDEFMSGKITASRAIEMRVRYGGETTEEARAKVEDWNFEKKYGFSYSNRKDAYINGEVSATTLRQAMISHKGMTAKDADHEIRALDLMKRNPNSGLDLTAAKAMTKKLDVINKTLDECGIKPDVYKKYKDLCKTAGSKKEDIMGVIHSLPLTKAQKDALYYLNGWSENTIDEAPWH